MHGANIRKNIRTTLTLFNERIKQNNQQYFTVTKYELRK
jgi:hypothetical protein